MKRGRPAKLTPEQLDDICWWYRHTALRPEAIGKRFNVSATTVRKVVAGTYLKKRQVMTTITKPVPQPYAYNAHVLAVIDGGTIDVVVDQGFNVSQAMRLRLARINVPELRAMDSPFGLTAKAALTGMIQHQAVVLQTFKDKTDKYGRYLADVWIDGECANDMLVAWGHAEYKEY